MFYDFNQSPDAIDMALHKTFDMVVVDPPFITRDVWEKYANTVYALLKKHPLDIKDGEEVSKVLCTTVFENAAMMKEFFGSKSQVSVANSAMWLCTVQFCSMHQFTCFYSHI